MKKNNILDEILNPLEQRQNTTVVNSCHFVSGVKTKRIHTKDGDTFKSYPNGYSQLDDQNICSLLFFETCDLPRKSASHL